MRPINHFNRRSSAKNLAGKGDAHKPASRILPFANSSCSGISKPLGDFMEDAGTVAGIGQHGLFKEEDCASPARLLWFWALPLNRLGFRV